MIIMRMAAFGFLDAALMPLLSIARRVGDARRPSIAVGDLEWKADPYGFERRPNCFLVARRYFAPLLEGGDDLRSNVSGSR
jgi:hypothetical protein